MGSEKISAKLVPHDSSERVFGIDRRLVRVEVSLPGNKCRAYVFEYFPARHALVLVMYATLADTDKSPKNRKITKQVNFYDAQQASKPVSIPISDEILAAAKQCFVEALEAVHP